LSESDSSDEDDAAVDGGGEAEGGGLDVSKAVAAVRGETTPAGGVEANGLRLSGCGSDVVVGVNRNGFMLELLLERGRLTGGDERDEAEDSEDRKGEPLLTVREW
jgi:hypothetical protein